MRLPLDARRRGLAVILGATAVAGACGYLIQLAAPALLGDAHAYLAFSVFWSTLYLFGSAVSGVQQELTRATHASPRPTGRRTLRIFTLGAAVVLAAVSALVGILLSSGPFAPAPAAMTVWFTVGLVGYLLMSILTGLMYGLELWGPIASLVVADALIRAVLVMVGFALGLSTGVLAALVASPFALAVGIVWLLIRRRVVDRFLVDVGARQLTANTLRTSLGAAAMGVLVTGLPLLLRTTMPNADAAALAGLVLVITITRAPLIIPLMALQSYLVVEFRRSSAHIWSVLSRYLLILAAVTAALAAAAWAGGPALIYFISHGQFAVAASTCAAVVASAGLVAAICITGPALLARGQHNWYVAGWVISAAATICLLMTPVEIGLKTALALLLAPGLGVIMNVLSVRYTKPATLTHEQ
jgi:O-antigen/teichoic acid export membrane protein